MKRRSDSSGPKAEPTPVFLVADDCVLRESLTTMLDAEGLQVTTTARDPAEALRQVARVEPPVILIDSRMGENRCAGFVQSVRAAAPATRVVLMHVPPHEDIVGYVRAGASGFVPKDADIGELARTIRSVARGASVLPTPLTSVLFNYLATRGRPRTRQSSPDTNRMTARERQVTELIAEGRSNGEIARLLGIATHTVKSHVHNILEKLALHSRLEIAAHHYTQQAEEPSRS